MTRTYWIRYNSVSGYRFDKVVHRSVEDRPMFHKVEALAKWREGHKDYASYGLMTASKSVFTRQEMKANGYI